MFSRKALFFLIAPAALLAFAIKNLDAVTDVYSRGRSFSTGVLAQVRPIVSCFAMAVCIFFRSRGIRDQVVRECNFNGLKTWTPSLSPVVDVDSALANFSVVTCVCCSLLRALCMPLALWAWACAAFSNSESGTAPTTRTSIYVLSICVSSLGCGLGG